jgi:putative FmdB family regulatory protein
MAPVPIYEYVCRRCAHQFEELVLGQAAPSCPGCRATDVERILSVVSVGRARDAGGGAPVGPCGTCGDPRGPGACASG